MRRAVVTIVSLTVVMNLMACSNTPPTENNTETTLALETTLENPVVETTLDSLSEQLQAISEDTKENPSETPGETIVDTGEGIMETEPIITEHQEVIPEKAEIDKLKEAINIPSDKAQQLLDAIKSKVPDTIDLFLVDIETEEQIILRVIDGLGDNYFAVIDKEYNLIKITYDSIENDPL